MATFLRILRFAGNPRIAGREEADLSVKSAQGQVLIPAEMASAMTELQKATLGVQKTSTHTRDEEGFVLVGDPPRHPRDVKTVTIKY